MSKRSTIIALIVIAIVGSVVAFFTSNLFFADVSNFPNGMSYTKLLCSMTGLMFGALLVTAAFYAVRLYKNPKLVKRMSSTYLFVAMGLSGVGFLTALLSGLIEYKSFIGQNPFPGYILIAMIVHLLVLGGAIFVFFKYVKPLPEDEEKFKVTPKHVFYTLGWFLFVSLAFNRFGAFLFMPTYVYLRNLEQTFVFYLFLLVPMLVLVKKGLDVFGFNYNKLIVSSVLLGVTVVLMAVVILIARGNAGFISAVSPAMPLDRLAAMPVEFIIHCLAYLSLPIFWFVKTLLGLKKQAE